ncbi:2,4-dichlorophenol 6-monooxygenase [Streptomyces sp. RB5]|uniref:2,4-dichlorophenol 6-monooxygenase n=1 Tax=Streptomyces smaragdinus TaxID=2585196 RepID=A0A7K0CQX5_9ACTN|nr:FAD-dependent monooxygenase [Streptomyces smaragdinus]MQY15876.1 2,4-dichlorophenol 6-monooxygenase [Streptomyces smaragdinus]
MTTVETDVLVVGSGPAGATAAALLSSQGIPTIMLNRYGSVANSPRAHITNQRTMEVLRDLGLEDQAKAWAMDQEMMGTTVWASSLTGMEFGRLRGWYTHPEWKGQHDLASATAICDLPQDRLEPILVSAAGLRGTTQLLKTELLTFTQDADGVTAQVRDRVTGHTYEIRAKYLIGADGGRSAVVEQLGLPLEGEMGEGGNINVVFEADLSHLLAHRPADMIWMIQPGTGHGGLGLGVLRMIQPYKRFMATWGYDPAEGTPELTDELGTRIAHQLIGDDTVPVTIESVSLWSVNHMNVTDNMSGRVFVAGDAAHRHTPMHGLGSNTSVQDSFNLAWKLAHVLKGLAGPGLLETYRAERVPVARKLVGRVHRTFGVVPPMFRALRLPPTADRDAYDAALAAIQVPTKENAAQRRELADAVLGTLPIFHTHGMEMNQIYDSTAVVTDGLPAPRPEKDPEFWYFPSTFPGHHLIHIWLTRDQRKVPLIDLVGKGRFTVLTGPSGAADWTSAAALVQDKLGLEVTVHTIGLGAEYQDTYGTFGRHAGIAEDGALLVRPDHMVGWRAQDSTHASRLVDVLRQILDR